jgi:hypothetical protein
MHFSSLHAYHMTIFFYYVTLTVFGLQIMNHFIMQFPLACSCVLPVRSKYFLQRPVFRHLQPVSFLSVRDQISHVCKTAVKFVVGLLHCFRSYIATE